MSGNPNGIKNNPAPSSEAGADGMEAAAGHPDEQKAGDTPKPNSPLAEGGMTGTGVDPPRNYSIGLVVLQHRPSHRLGGCPHARAEDPRSCGCAAVPVDLRGL